MAQSDAISNIDQKIDGNVRKVITAVGDIIEIHHHHHSRSTRSTNNDDKNEQTTGSLEIRCIDLKITVLNPWHTGMIIVGGLVLNRYFGDKILKIIKDLVATCGSLVVKARPGSLELFIFNKDRTSKQTLIKDLLSNSRSAKIKSIVGGVESDIKIEVTCIGAVIATSEEFSNFKN